MSLMMIDLSSNNHESNAPINWKKVAKFGVKGVIIKATEALDYINPWLRNDCLGARSVGLHVGYYHFARPSASGGVEQAQYVMNTVKGLPRDLGISLDLEVWELSVEETSTWAEGFLSTISAAKILSPFYTYPDFLSNLPRAPFNHPLWLASPSAIPRRSTWMWQKAASQIPGIDGLVDIDAYNG